MKSIKSLLDTIKDLIAEASQSQSGYENLRLIPVPSNNRERNLPQVNNNQ
jgi:hypothetical protein